MALKVSDNVYQAVPHDPQRDVFKLPDFVRTMVERGMLGDKTGGGFYRKEGKEIRTLDWKTLEYRERRKPKLPAVEAAQNVADLGARINQIMAREGQGGHLPVARAVGDELLRGVAGARDLRRHRGPSTGPWSGATSGASVRSG